MCEFCSVKPVFRNSWCDGKNVYDEEESRKILCSCGMYADLVIGADESGEIYMAAQSAEDSQTIRWYPNFCPVCGADLRGGELHNGTQKESDGFFIPRPKP